ncbi:thiamine phosphate synthase [Paenibacillus larvae]|uniref:thiamine phosphate synthase n=1 Tax=Paenibacillus larvae TaxID=1464 RepID=UPI00227DB285|nr:thiamine phosphate synthase [Paenibacillus larvae]MCY9509768.1 thiamine phosphate synthase [Paenibacillus larvae]MCY9525701.1 thiamine phosphate synthase [Paenibacillus larvae]
MRNIVEFHLITTGKQSVSCLIGIAEQVHSYVTAIHVREKKKSAAELIEIASSLLERGVPASKIYINDRLDVACSMNLGGCQLASHSVTAALARNACPGLRLGCSVHALEEAKSREADGADYILFGHLYPTACKPGIPPAGIPSLRQLCSRLSIPVLAIGGIIPGNVSEVLEAGAAGFAVMSGVWEAAEPLDAVHEYRKAVERGMRNVCTS